MTKEDKELLLKDLCARLPYEDCVHIVYKTGEPCYGKLTARDIQWFIDSKIENIKPYLRPMSSMTEEEKRQYMGFIAYSGNPNGSANFVDWLNEHHFDYRTTYDESKEKWLSMIGKGLAIEVTEENNPYK